MPALNVHKEGPGLSQMWGEILGKGLSNFNTNYNANKALDKVLNDPKYKESPASEKMHALSSALTPFGEVGEGLLMKRLGVEDQAMQERQQKDLSEIWDYYQRGENPPQKLMERQPQEVQFKIGEGLKSKRIGDNFYKAAKNAGMPEELAAYHRDTIGSLQKGEGLTQAINAFEKDMQRYKSISGLDESGNKLPLTPEEKVKRQEIGLKDTQDYRQDLAKKAEYARRGIQNKKFALSLIEGGEKLDDPVYVEFANRLPGGIKGKLLSPKTQLYQSGLFDEFGVLKSMFPGQIRVKEIELLEDKLATLDKSPEAKKQILEHGIKKLDYDIILSKAAANIEKNHPEAGALEFDQLAHEEAQPELDRLYDEMIKGYEDIYKKYAKPKPGFVFLEDSQGKMYEIPVAEANELKKKHNLKERK